MSARLLSIAATAAVMSVVAATPASAMTRGGNPWSEVNASSYVAPAGSRCAFPLEGTVLEDKERIRTLTTYPDGSARTQKVVGQLKIRYTNGDSGASVDRNLTGNGIFTWRQDGSLEELVLQGGHMAVGFGPGDEEGPSSLVLTGAGHSVTFGSDGTRTLRRGSGPVEDLCATLG